MLAIFMPTEKGYIWLFVWQNCLLFAQTDEKIDIPLRMKIKYLIG